MRLSQFADLGKLTRKVLSALTLTDPHAKPGGGAITWATVNLYHINELFVLRLTAPYRCSFMELVGKGPQDPEWFVSHWWGTPFSETLEMLQYHARERGLSSKAAYWICTFANNQHDLEELKARDLRETPFVRAIMSPSCLGTVMLMDQEATPFRRTWCTLENFISTTDGREKAPALRLDIGAVIKAGTQRAVEWGFASNEVDVPALLLDDGTGKLDDRVAVKAIGLQFPPAVAAAAVRTDVAAAHASNPADKRSILRLIIGQGEKEHSEGGSQHAEPPARHPRYDVVNLSIQRIFAKRALFGAAYACDAAEVARLLGTGLAHVSEEDQSGRTPLIAACQNLSGEADEGRRVPVVRCLLEQRADPNHRTTSLGICGLHPAAYWNLPETLDVLVAAGGDVNLARSCDGMRPIHEARANGSKEAVKKLLALGAARP